ncbi:PREDICTED: gamma-tubulin complex component 6 [Vollenhovia emeryi]|uniref:gamma-tubulin complex component 6 n=1 Tax=Vollenhovia emeryi TaxID=411798 RepID=UPI0005F46B41|nr:PREDICTED: gamma-tubulin complex component 6 [Vollenhovia emeryi]
MDPERGDANVYELVTQLVGHALRRDRAENACCYVPPASDVRTVRGFRSRAYEILLNKSGTAHGQGRAAEIDPLVEILKHAFVLRLSLRRASEARELEGLISQLYDQGGNTDAVVSTLRLLVELKSFQTDTEAALDVFHYGRANPFLPEDAASTNGVPTFQTYPVESFVLSDKFEAMLGVRRTCTRQDTATSFVSRASLENQCVSKAILGVQTVRYNNAIEMIPCISSCTEDTANQCSMVVPFLAHIMVEQTNKIYLSTQRFMSNTTVPCEWMKPVDNQSESRFCAVPSGSPDRSFASESKGTASILDLMWREVLFSGDRMSELRTWESLGAPELSGQSLFVTDLPETALHLARIRQTSILSLLPKKAMHSISLMREVSPERFLSDVKLLLFGIDSESFRYDALMGFELDENITVHGIGFEALRITCQEAVRWGNSFRSLTQLVVPDPQTGKLQQNGLIFKAMCANVKELLLYYRSALQRILDRREYHGLLSLFKRVRPLAQLIVEVARLCGCRANQCTLGGGSGILTHIYKEVTKVTNPKVALVLYSTLKSCCEVYFRFLQNWLFEGTCDDVYGEFMIQGRSHYLRKKGRKFWTESFAIDTKSVPGFLSELSESILQCGKTLRLLKICSPKNPVCNVSLNAQPEVKVCLSVSMLREQLSRCQEYERKGEAALGPIVSLLSAIQDEKKADRETAELVIRAQQETLSRLDEQRKELIMKAAQSKRELLQELKQQAEASALIKEREKENEMLADKLLLEKINREQEEIREQQQAERENLVNYYEKLTADIESKRARSIWRKMRMSHFERRVELLKSVKRLDREISENATTRGPDENIVDINEQNKNVTSEVSSQDENSNFAENGLLDVVVDANISDQSNSKEDHLAAECAGSDASPVEDRELDKDTESDKEITSEDSVATADPPNVHLPQESLPLDYKMYKRNNERSNLQDFLRDEAMKSIHTIMNDDDKKSRLNDILETDEVTERIIGAIKRPKSLAIKINNMTTAQTNRLKVLMQEYGMTPNNNELSTILTDNQGIIDRANTNGNKQVTDVSESSSDSTKENNNVLSTTNIKLPEETANVPTNDGECPSKTNDASDEVHEQILNNTQQQNNIDTPMSCTTDNFTTASMHTPLSQIPNSDDIFALNAGQEVSSLSDDVAKSITEETCFESPMSSNFKLPNLFGVSYDVKSSAAPSSLTIADVEMIDHTSLQVYLEKSIIIPLQIQTRLVNNAIIKYLVNEHNMLSHLHSLRSYFFLLNGEFAKSLTDSLYSRLYAISAPIELFNSATLTNLLEKALMNSFSNNYAHSELLSLSAVDKPCQLYISDPNVLECLCLNYKISWPLNIILDDTMMLQYSKVFKFLIMIGRMSWVLQEDFNIMKVERSAVNSEQYHKLQLYRHSMTQFMNALRNYLTCSVLHASWNEFERDLQNSRTIDQIYLSHMSYIKRILSRCMLNTRGEKMRACLINVFKIILKFHNRLRSQAWAVGSAGQYGHPNFKSLEQMYKSFCDWRTYMAHIAHKLATSGYQPHLTHFLNALNINHMYDLTIKQQ